MRRKTTLSVIRNRYISMKTNRYAWQRGYTRFEVSSEEIAAFVGMNIATGIVRFMTIGAQIQYFDTLGSVL